MEAFDGNFKAVIPESASAGAPLITLLGWAGAQDRALAKYADLVHSTGNPSVRSVMPLGTLFSPFRSARQRWALSLLHFIESDKCWKFRPLYFYAFSNGGAFVIDEIVQLISSPQYQNIKDRICGFIFDSAPAYIHKGTGYKVLQSTMEPGMPRFLALTYLHVTDSLKGWVSSKPPGLDFFQRMLELDWKPQLFLYSMDDTLCDGVKLKELIQEKIRRCQNVKSLCWERSAHCGHLKHHPEEYRTAVLEFLSNPTSSKL